VMMMMIKVVSKVTVTKVGKLIEHDQLADLLLFQNLLCAMIIQLYNMMARKDYNTVARQD